MGQRLTPEDLAAYPAEVFVETGTGQGDSLAVAVERPYAALHSIEWHPEHAGNARRRHARDQRVHVHTGSSPVVLPTILDRSKRTLLWLDAHYQGTRLDELDPAFGQCPLLAELAAIFGGEWEADPVVLIDDAHCFADSCGRPMPGLPPFDRAQWPTVEQIRAALPGHYQVETHNDILVCKPVDIKRDRRLDRVRQPADEPAAEPDPDGVLGEPGAGRPDPDLPETAGVADGGAPAGVDGLEPAEGVRRPGPPAKPRRKPRRKPAAGA